jgi:RNA polymerase sigma-70 factor (ECF subfamily)
MATMTAFAVKQTPAGESRPRPFADAVAHCVGQLPRSLRDAFVLRELEGMSCEAIAEITGCNVGTVRTRLSWARSSFVQLIQALVR